MYEVPCLDLNGDTINKFYQWDIDQKIVINLEGCDVNYLKNAPEVHFCNSSRKEALVVRSTVSNNDTITVDVPNVLLQEAYPLLVYVYLTDANDSSSQKTILYSEIPVRKRAKPSDYLYVENITRVTAEMIKKEIEQTTLNARTDAIAAITSTKENDCTEVDNKKAGFITTGTGLVQTATEIKNNTQITYNNAVSVANRTQTTIENNMNDLMLRNGINLKTVNDGNGNVNLAVVINS
jgi:hypothetical protein